MPAHATFVFLRAHAQLWDYTTCGGGAINNMRTISQIIAVITFMAFISTYYMDIRAAATGTAAAAAAAAGGVAPRAPGPAAADGDAEAGRIVFTNPATGKTTGAPPVPAIVAPAPGQ